jgi:hypothetical protein
MACGERKRRNCHVSCAGEVIGYPNQELFPHCERTQTPFRLKASKDETHYTDEKHLGMFDASGSHFKHEGGVQGLGYATSNAVCNRSIATKRLFLNITFNLKI